MFARDHPGQCISGTRSRGDVSAFVTLPCGLRSSTTNASLSAFLMVCYNGSVAELSLMIPLGTAAPDFALPDVVSGDVLSRDAIARGRPLLVVFASRHCPYMQHCKMELARLGRDYGDRVGMAAISSNDAARYADDKPESL